MLYCRLPVLIFIYCLLSAIFPLQAQPCSQPTNLSIAGQNASHPQIAIDPFGNITAVWYRFDGDHLVIQASTKELESDWQAIPDNLSLADQDAFNPQIAIDLFGNIIVVWEQFNGTHSIIQSAEKKFGSCWQSIPDQLSITGQNASAPQIAIDSLGHAITVWQAYNGSHNIIQASIKALEGKWQTIPNCLSSSNLNAKNPQIVIDAYENATVVWQASDGMQEVIQSSSKLFQENWQLLPDTISSKALNNSSPQIAADSYGNVTVVWNQFNGDNGVIQASTKFYGGSWQVIPDILSVPGCNTFSPQIVIDLFGNITVVWESSDINQLRCIHASTKIFGKSWQIYPNVLSILKDHNLNPQIAADRLGNIVVVWNNYKGFTHIYISKKDIEDNWQSIPEMISPAGRSAFFPQLVINSTGKAIVIWVMQDSLSFIQSINY